MTAAYIEDALEALPGGVIDSVMVDVEKDSDGSGILGMSIEEYPCDMLIVVTFDGNEVSVDSFERLGARGVFLNCLLS